MATSINLFLLTFLVTTTLTYQDYQFTVIDAFSQSPLFSIGALSAGDVVRFNIQFPVNTTVSPHEYRLQIMKSDYSQPNPTPPEFNTNYPIPANLTVDFTWTVAESASYLILTSISPSTGSNALQLYYLTVTHSNGA